MEGGSSMKELNEIVLPEDLRYTKEHEWAKASGDVVRVGITDYAQDELGDIVFVEPPQVGESFTKGDQFGTLESTKAVADLFIPVSGEVTAINEELAEAPELVNQDPYDKGWIAEVKPANPAEMDELMTAEQYKEMLEGLK
jgi:glycine cleavage system H protein